MVLKAHLVWQSWMFWEKKLLPQKWTSNGFLNLLENLVIFFWIWPIMKVWKFPLFEVFVHKSYVWEKSDSWDKDQNALGQSDCRIFKSTISLQQNDEKVLFFARWYRFMETKSWLKHFVVDVVINGCGHYSHRTQCVDILCVDTNSGNLKVSFFIFGWCWLWWWKKMSVWPFRYWTLKSVVTQEQIDEVS